MGRAKRPYLPGGFFHVTARTQSRIHWFDDDLTKDHIVAIIADAVEACDCKLIAFVVMNNHLHFVLRQQVAPISAFMQPALRRIALTVKSTYGLDDHLFGAPYWGRSCRDAADLRGCIRYVHRNPLRAGVCSDPADYPWSSHNAYALLLEAEHWRPRMCVLRGIFAQGSCRSQRELALDYLRFLAEDSSGSGRPALSGLHYGDAFARDLMADGSRGRTSTPRKRRDLRDIVRQGIAELCPGLDIEMVRSFRGVLMSKVRANLVQRAARAGYRGCQIARYLDISESSVSRIIHSMPPSARVARVLR